MKIVKIIVNIIGNNSPGLKEGWLKKDMENVLKSTKYMTSHELWKVYSWVFKMSTSFSLILENIPPRAFLF